MINVKIWNSLPSQVGQYRREFHQTGIIAHPRLSSEQSGKAGQAQAECLRSQSTSSIFERRVHDRNFPNRIRLRRGYPRYRRHRKTIRQRTFSRIQANNLEFLPPASLYAKTNGNEQYDQFTTPHSMCHAGLKLGHLEQQVEILSSLSMFAFEKSGRKKLSRVLHIFLQGNSFSILSQAGYVRLDRYIVRSSLPFPMR
jgi:hypothetical protein